MLAFFWQFLCVDIYFYTILALGLSCGIYLLTRGLAMYVGDAVAERVALALIKNQTPQKRKA
jgi:hypothetical protein